MADSLKLPDLITDDENETVLFEWKPLFPDWLTLVVVKEEPEELYVVEGLEDEDTDEEEPESGLGGDEEAVPEYSTYRVRLNDPKHQPWFHGLKNWRRIVRLVKMYGQVYYWPATGAVEDAGDKDEERTHRVRGLFTQARREQEQKRKRENYRIRKISARRNRQQEQTGLPPRLF